MHRRQRLPFLSLLLLAGSATLAAQTPPPAPVLSAPANGASLVQPITLQWQAVVDPDGPIGSYSWEVGTSSTFSTVIASGFNNFDLDVPLPTKASVSGLPNGTYFWHVKAAQDQGPNGFFDSAWSSARSFTVTGIGPAPAGSPVITSPAPNSSFHVREFFDIVWTEVAGAQYYILEADDDAAFSHPITLGSTVEFGTKFNAGWGNALPNVFYRVRAVSSDNVRGLPSATLTVHITNTAPVPGPPTPLSPVGGATITLPFQFDWTDTANPQIAGYDIDIDDDPNFAGDIGVLMVTQISRSDYMVVPDPLVEGINRLPAGTYFWRVRAVHGDVLGPWSAGASFKISALPATPAGLDLFWIISDPGSVEGGNPTAARIALNQPAPAGGMRVFLASDFPGVEIPPSVVIPAGSTDAVVTPVTTPPVHGASVGTLRAAFGLKWQQSSIGCFPILWGGSLAAERVVGGGTVTGQVTLLGPAPPGGVEVAIRSNDTALAKPPATVLIPEGATEATFDVATAAVSVPTRIVFDFGTGFEGYQSPQTWLVLNPAGSPAPPSALSALSLSASSVLGGASATGTVTLTSPAPAGGLQVKLSGSMEGDVVVPQDVTVPAGALSATFPITPPKVARPHWVIIQGSVFPLGMLHAETLRVDPGGPGPSPLSAIDVRPNSAIGGASLTGTVGLSVPAPAGGASVSLVSSDTAHAQVPASVAVPAGNSTASFTVTTTAVETFTTASITGSAAGVDKTAFISLSADPNAPLSLLSITPSVSGTTGGNPINTTIFLTKNAPAGGAVVTLSSSKPAAAQVPTSVTVPAGLGFVTLNITTSPVAVDTPVTITGVLNGTKTAVITVLAPPRALAALSVSPASVVGGTAATGTATLTAAAPSGGTPVSLSSSNSAVASVPTSVTVPAGATSATFPVTTTVVAGSTPVTLTGSAGGATRTATLTVTPSGAGGPAFKAPTANAADAGGDGNGFEITPANAQIADGTSAVDNNSGTANSSSCTSASRDKHRFFNYGLTVPAGQTVGGIEVRLDARADGTTGTPKMCVQLSWDGGASWTAAKSTAPLTTTMATYVLGGPADTWGRAWTSSEVSNANFRVRVIDVAASTARDFFLDWAAVRLTTSSAPPATPTPTRTPTPTSVAPTATRTPTSATPQPTATRTPTRTPTSSVPVATPTRTPTPSAPTLDLALSGVPASIARGQFFTASGTVVNTGGSAASGYSVNITFTPTDSMRLESPQSATQALPTVAAGGSQAVSWQMRADNTATATVTMKLLAPGGATVDTASKAITITN